MKTQAEDFVLENSRQTTSGAQSIRFTTRFGKERARQQEAYSNRRTPLARSVGTFQDLHTPIHPPSHHPHLLHTKDTH